MSTCKKYNELIFFYYVLTRRRKRLKPTVRVTYHFENEVKRTRVEQIRSEKSVEEGDRQEEDLHLIRQFLHQIIMAKHLIRDIIKD